jgi:L-asparaginase II
MTDLIVVATRGHLPESVHQVSAAVVNSDGRLLGQAGDPQLITYWRSAAKPFQLLPLVADGGIERFGLDQPMLALACGSHNAESVHREVAARWLTAIGASESDLACGGHPSLWPALADAMIHDDVTPSPIWSNCSGKHASLLALARLHGWGTSGYEERSHPVQQRVAETIADWSAIRVDELQWGVDGCTAAAVALPLTGMARAYARLGVTDAPSVRSIRDAMIAEPYLIAGADRLDTVLMQAWPGRVIAKIGAEGVYSASLPTLDLGIAIKVHDGDMRAVGIALMAVLEATVARFGINDRWAVDALGEWRAPAIRNTRGTTTGHIEVRGGLHWQ